MNAQIRLFKIFCFDSAFKQKEISKINVCKLSGCRNEIVRLIFDDIVVDEASHGPTYFTDITVER